MRRHRRHRSVEENRGDVRGGNPTFTFDTEAASFGPNFLYTTSSTPEPGTLMLPGSGLLGRSEFFAASSTAEFSGRPLRPGCAPVFFKRSVGSANEMARSIRTEGIAPKGKESMVCAGRTTLIASFRDTVPCVPNAPRYSPTAPSRCSPRTAWRRRRASGCCRGSRAGCRCQRTPDSCCA
jgi:hypothetical protein